MLHITDKGYRFLYVDFTFRLYLSETKMSLLNHIKSKKQKRKTTWCCCTVRWDTLFDLSIFGLPEILSTYCFISGRAFCPVFTFWEIKVQRLSNTSSYYRCQWFSIFWISMRCHDRSTYCIPTREGGRQEKETLFQAQPAAWYDNESGISVFYVNSSNLIWWYDSRSIWLSH